MLVGVSPDPAPTHSRFKSELNLPFPLISDESRRIIRLYEADRRFCPGVRRITYVIDADGVIRAAFQHEIAIDRHINDTVGALRELYVKDPERNRQ